MLSKLRPSGFAPLALTSIFLISGHGKSSAQYEFVPAAPQWNPTEILGWSPATDANAPYNRSKVPLATRFTAPTAASSAALNSVLNVNSHARPGEARLQAVTSFNTIPVGSPNGWRTTRLCAPSMWQYTDNMVFWGGSDRDTKTILTPTAHTIDAAHRNGVRIYGKVFFGWNGEPDNATLQKVRDLLVKSGDTFPVADKMVEAAIYYGFDGWFINQENYQTNAADAQNMLDFLSYFRNKAAAMGAPDLKITWYDAMAEDGSRSFQNAFTTTNDAYLKRANGTLTAHEMFLNFWWYNTPAALSNSRSLAQSLSLDPYNLYAGIWTENNRTFGNTPDPNGGGNIPIPWSYLFPEGQPHHTSIALYGAETPFYQGNSLANVLEKEHLYWSGPNADPTNTAATASLTNWSGFAHYIPANSSITSLPFVTNFNLGQGTQYKINGVTSMTGPWTNLSVQDLLPTWRWIVQSSGTKLAPTFDYTDSYYGGTSLKVAGTLTADQPNEIKLYQTNLPVTADTKISLTYKRGAIDDSQIQVGVAFDDSPGTMVYTTAASASSTDWTSTGDFSLGTYAGKKIVLVTLKFFSASTIASYAANIGRLQITDAATALPSPPSDLTLEGKARNPDEATSCQLRLKWTASPSPVLHYNVYHRKDLTAATDGQRVWLGATPNNYFFASDVRRTGIENEGYIQIEAIGPDYAAAPSISTAQPTFVFESAPNLSHPVITSYPLASPVTLIAKTAKNTNVNVFDNAFITVIEPGAANGEWIGLDLGAGNAKQITAIKFVPRTGYVGNTLNGRFQASNSADFSTGLVDLAKINARSPEGVETTLLATDPGSYRYLRYLSPDGGYARMAEIKFFAAGDILPEDPPIGLQATSTATAANLFWTPPYAGSPTGYNIKRATQSGGPYTTIASDISGTSYQDSSSTSGTTYYYVVSSNGIGGESTNSAQLILNPSTPKLTGAALISGGTVTNANNGPSKALDGNPATFYETSTTSAFVGYDFGAGNGKAITAIRYMPRTSSDSTYTNQMLAGRFQASNSSNFLTDTVTFLTIANPAISGTPTTVAVVPSTKTYRYVRYLGSTVRVTNLAEFEIYGGTLPAAPANPTANAKDASATLTWLAVPGATRYAVKRATSSGGPYEIITSDITALTYTDTGLVPGNTYFYVISAFNAIGEGSHSEETSSYDPYARWLTDSGQSFGSASSAFNADFNQNGLPNGVEYMTSGPVKMLNNSGTQTMTAIVRTDRNVPYIVEVSDNLLDWTSGNSAPSSDQTGVPTGFIRIEAADPLNRFFRIRFTR